MHSEIGDNEMKLSGHDLILQERNLDVEQNVIQWVVLLVSLGLQIQAVSDAAAFLFVH